jgi:hypothetical protein
MQTPVGPPPATPRDDRPEWLKQMLDTFLNMFFGFCRRPERAQLPKEDLYSKLSENVTPAYTKLARTTKRNIISESNSKNYSKATIVSMYDSLLEISTSKYVEMTTSLRTSRRRIKALNAMESYEHLVSKVSTEIEQMLNQNMNFVIKDCGVDIEKFQTSHAYHEKNDHDFHTVAYT